MGCVKVNKVLEELSHYFYLLQCDVHGDNMHVDKLVKILLFVSTKYKYTAALASLQNNKLTSPRND